MDAQTIDDSSEKMYWYLGDGALLSLFWWGLAQASNPLSSALIWPSLIIALGGFALGLPGLLWLKTLKPSDPQNGERASFWLTLSILYPIALLGLFLFNHLNTSPTGRLTFLAHPMMLTINLAAGLLAGPVLNRFGAHLSKGIALTVWWLWQLPLIFINGSALLLYNFSNLLMLFYLATVLSLSGWLFWYPMKSM